MSAIFIIHYTWYMTFHDSTPKNYFPNIKIKLNSKTWMTLESSVMIFFSIYFSTFQNETPCTLIMMVYFFSGLNPMKTLAPFIVRLETKWAGRISPVCSIFIREVWTRPNLILLECTVNIKSFFRTSNFEC